MATIVGRLSSFCLERIPYFCQNDKIKNITEELQLASRLSSAEAQTNDLIQRAVKLKDGLSLCQKKCSNAYNDFELQLLAARLGVNASLLENNKDFCKFAGKSRLYNYLAYHNDRVEVINGEPAVRYKGEYTAWSQIDEKPEPGYTRTTFPWVYGPEGIINNQDMYHPEGDELPVNKTYTDEEARALWGGDFAIRLITCCVKNPRKTGDHVLLQFCFPRSGDSPAYTKTVSIYRNNKLNKSDNVRLPFRIQPAFTTSPDPTIYWGLREVDIQSLIIERTEDELKNMERNILARKNKEVFNPAESNCSHFSIKYGQLPKKLFDVRDHVARVIIPESVLHITDKIYSVLPTVIQKICDLFFTFITNLVLVGLGAWSVDEEVLKQNPDAKPYLGWNLFDQEKVMFWSPHKIGMEVIPAIKRWRNEDIENRRYKLPDLSYEELLVQYPPTEE